MNWLAHVFLARHDDAAMLGALLGDFVHGRSGLDRFGAVEHVEILVHRRVDGFTDAHPRLATLRAQAASPRLFGIVLDVYFDHRLARDFERWRTVVSPHAPPLRAFTSRLYATLRARHAELPVRLQAIAPSMIEGDWLGAYASRATVDQAVVRIARRLSRRGEELVAALDDLRRLDAAADDAFDAFFLELLAFADGERARLSPSR